MISKDPRSSLPPGFRFHPTDEELILHYLRKKVSSSPVPLSIIADVDIYKSDPWDLPAKAPFGEKEWYFFSPRDRKYPNGARPNRAAASGYWKATGTDKLIAVANGEGFHENIGIKKALVFYKGKPPKGVKTNWIMHEYRLAESFSPKRANSSGSQVNHFGDRNLKSKEYSMRLDDWVLCRIYKKSHASLSSSDVPSVTSNQEQEEKHNEPYETFLPNLQQQNDQPLKRQKSSCSFSNLLDATDLTFLTNFLNETPDIRTDDQSDFSFTIGNFSNPDTYGNHYLDQKLPRLSSPASETSGIGNKGERSLDFAEETMNNTSKKTMMMNTYSYNNSVDHLDHGMIQQSSFLNQELLMSYSHLQYQGR